MTGSRAWWRFLDERDARGGRLKAWLFLTHPGPSLLVTAVTVATAGLVARQLPSLRTAVGLVLVMLPAQLAIGALNDWADVDADSVWKPFKPLVRGGIPRGHAALAAAAGFAVSLGAAAWLGPGPLLVALLGAGAGVAYDLALKRTPLSVLAWIAGFMAVPLLGMAVTARWRGAGEAVPLAVLVAVALQLANGLPDADADAASGMRTLASVLGARARAVMTVSLAVAAAYVVVVRVPLRQDGAALVSAAFLLGGAVVAALTARLPRWAFPLLALVVAVASLSWLAALPAL